MDKQYVLGIDVGGTSTKMAIFSLAGEMVAKWAISTNRTNTSLNLPVDISISVKKTLEEYAIKNSQMLAAGVGIPGFVLADQGMVISSVNLGLENYLIAPLLEKELGFPVCVDNDANLAAAGEKWKGAGRHVSDLIFITLGTGVGSGILLNGEIFRGAGHAAGEIGHVTVLPQGGSPCKCGKYGCLETISSATGIARLAKENALLNKNSKLYDLMRQRELTAEDVFRSMDEGDNEARVVVEKAMKYLGIALANTANVLQPQYLIIGGGLAAAGNSLIRPLEKHFNFHALQRIKQVAKVKLAELGNDAGVTGGAWLALKQYGKHN
ncbi:ROK family glucokinase [Alteribacillus iranensis]|uniref:Glucokinase n=1 Tax=Alteribacillus iranensis TaxID=930128 RepID=A0A1I1ZHG6_9BACI|nr:ROK family glucokinase [Alteribacillus iranensis]SFE30003.1 glucokinase [Alteribacillus iranensis]